MRPESNEPVPDYTQPFFKPTSPMLFKFEPTNTAPLCELYYVGRCEVSEGSFDVWREKYVAVGDSEIFWSQQVPEPPEAA